jgi:phosphoribosyl 1,2-cyclic phosphodiesterase
MKGHMNLKTLLEVVESAQPKRVIITHLYPEWDNYNYPLPSPLLMGEDGMEIEL